MSYWTRAEKDAYKIGIAKGRKLQLEDDIERLKYTSQGPALELFLRAFDGGSEIPPMPPKRATADDIDRLIAAVERLIERKGKK